VRSDADEPGRRVGKRVGHRVRDSRHRHLRPLLDDRDRRLALPGQFARAHRWPAAASRRDEPYRGLTAPGIGARAPLMPHGWLSLGAPRGVGSTRAVAAVKRVLRKAGCGKVKIGHGGTLDPLAEGVLPIAVGEATKLAGRRLDASKTYAFTIAF